jgi:hypothetical protein
VGEQAKSYRMAGPYFIDLNNLTDRFPVFRFIDGNGLFSIFLCKGTDGGEQNYYKTDHFHPYGKSTYLHIYIF